MREQRELRTFLTNGLQMMLTNMDFGHPMKSFFIEIPKLLDLGRQFGQINLGAFGVFSDNLSAPIFFINKPLFLQKAKPLYPDWDLNLMLGRKELRT